MKLDAAIWDWDKGRQISTLARNLGTRYLGIGIEAILGLLILPFNVRMLGAAEYGLWMLAASVVALRATVAATRSPALRAACGCVGGTVTSHPCRRGSP